MMCFCIEVDLESCFWPRLEHLFLKNMHFVHGPLSRPFLLLCMCVCASCYVCACVVIKRLMFMSVCFIIDCQWYVHVRVCTMVMFMCLFVCVLCRLLFMWLYY